MLNVNEVWQRVSQLPQYRGKQLSDLIIQAWDLNATLTTGQVLDNQVLPFAPASIILGIAAAARPDTVAATVVYAPGLDLFKISITDQQSNRAIVGRTRAIGSSVFGHYNDIFPAKEILIPVNGALVYSLENLTTTTINLTITHHILVTNAIS